MLPRYKVRVQGDMERVFDTIVAAMEYATRSVYMAPRHFDMCEISLRAGDSYAYEYGFKSVELEATAKEIPKRVLSAAPEMLQALKNIVSSAPLIGLPLALEKDIQSACDLIARLEEK